MLVEHQHVAAPRHGLDDLMPRIAQRRADVTDRLSD